MLHIFFKSKNKISSNFIILFINLLPRHGNVKSYFLNVAFGCENVTIPGLGSNLKNLANQCNHGKIHTFVALISVSVLGYHHRFLVMKMGLQIVFSQLQELNL